MIIDLNNLSSECEKIRHTKIEEMAKYFHDNYEFFAKETNWNTQSNCKVEFEDLPTNNQKTMIKTTNAFMLKFVFPLLLYIDKLKEAETK